MKRHTLLLGLLAVALALELTLPNCVDPSTPPQPDRHEAANTQPPWTGSNAQACLRSATFGQLLHALPRTPDRAPADVSSADYDPVLLNNAARPSALFASEPVDPAFAAAREAELKQRIRTRLARRLYFGVSFEVECHTSSCQITFDEADIQSSNAIVSALDTQLLAEASELAARKSPNGEILPGMSVVLLFSAQSRDDVVYQRQLSIHAREDGAADARRDDVAP